MVLTERFVRLSDFEGTGIARTRRFFSEVDILTCYSGRHDRRPENGHYRLPVGAGGCEQGRTGRLTLKGALCRVTKRAH